MKNIGKFLAYGISGLFSLIPGEVKSQEFKKVEPSPMKTTIDGLEELLKITDKEHPEFNLTKTNPDELDEVAVVFSYNRCGPCKPVQGDFRDFAYEASESEKLGRNKGFFIFEKFEGDKRTEDPYIGLRTELSSNSFPSGAIFKRGDLNGDSWEVEYKEGNIAKFDRFRRELRRQFLGENIGLRVENPGEVLDALEIGGVQERYEKDEERIIVNISNADRFSALKFAFKYGASFKNESSKIRKALRVSGELELDQKTVEYLVRKYMPEKADGILNNKSTWPDEVFFSRTRENPSLYDILHDGAGDAERKTRFDEREKKDRIMWYEMVSNSYNSHIPNSVLDDWNFYLINARSRFEGTSKEYTFPSWKVGDKFREHVDRWKAERDIRVVYQSPINESDLAVSDKNIDEETRKELSENLKDEYEERLERYTEFRKKGVVYLPEDTPAAILESMMRENDFAVVIKDYEPVIRDRDRLMAAASWKHAILNLAELNRTRVQSRELGIYVLGGEQYELGFFQPLEAGIKSFLIPHIMYPYGPLGAASFENKGKRQIGSVYSAEDLGRIKISIRE